jgi:hypothetical protein
MIGWIKPFVVISCTLNFVIKVLVARPLARGDWTASRPLSEPVAATSSGRRSP